MSRLANVEGFGPKLKLALDRLNLARGGLAQKVGVDKSVVHRWVSGTTKPAENNLVAITALVQEGIPGFSKADWTLPEAGFAAKLGMSARRNEGPLGATLARAHANREQAIRYCGLWLMLYPSIQAEPSEFRLCGVAVEIFEGQDGVECLLGDGPDGAWTGGGPILALGDKLYLFMEREPAQDALALTMFWGVPTGVPGVLDGLCLSRSGNVHAAPSAMRYLALRLAPAAASMMAAEARWQRTARHLAELRNTLGQELPAALVARLRGDSGAVPTGPTFRLPNSESLAGSEYEIFLIDRPDSPRRMGIEAARKLFAPVLGA